MEVLVVIIILGLVGWFWLPKANKKLNITEDNLCIDKVEARQKQVVEYLEENQEITNDQYQKLTGISDAQATRDLDKLEEQGAIEQIGKTGSGVVYRMRK